MLNPKTLELLTRIEMNITKVKRQCEKLPPGWHSDADG